MSVLSLFGPLTLRRRYYHDPAKGRGRCPLDKALGLVGEFTPALARLGTRAAAQSPFECASADLAEYAGVKVPGRQLQRLVEELAPQMRQDLQRRAVPAQVPVVPVLYIEVDGTGVPMRPTELEGVKGKGQDGKASTREVKLACLFTQSDTDEDGRPVRDEDSTTYVSSFESARDFGPLVRREALRRGYARSQTTLLLGDGAAWVWELARTNFPDAINILDFYHASEHLAALERLLPAVAVGNGSSSRYELWRQWLRDSRLDDILTGARACLPAGSAPDEAVEREIAYLENNRCRMDYAHYQAEGWFIGSGAVEAGCKSVVGQRLKNSGMKWTLPGARNILTLRCALHSQTQFADWWNKREHKSIAQLRAA